MRVSCFFSKKQKVTEKTKNSLYFVWETCSIILQVANIHEKTVEGGSDERSVVRQNKKD